MKPQRSRYRMAESLSPTGMQENWRRVYVDATGHTLAKFLAFGLWVQGVGFGGFRFRV